MKYHVTTLRLTHKNLFIAGMGNLSTNVIPNAKTGNVEMETCEGGVLVKIKGKSVIVPWGQIELVDGVTPVVAEVEPVKAVARAK